VKTLHRPLRVLETTLADGTPALASDGAPSDCVALPLLGLIEEKVDMVVSGINPNANLGHDVTYSGTVTAAMEAVIDGLPGIAVSLDSPENHGGKLDYATAASVARRVAGQVIWATPFEEVISTQTEKTGSKGGSGGKCGEDATMYEAADVLR